MAGWDKALATETLLALGWAEVPDRPGQAPYHLVPPEHLWTNRPASLYVYDARDLQDLLGPHRLGEEALDAEP